MTFQFVDAGVSVAFQFVDARMRLLETGLGLTFQFVDARMRLLETGLGLTLQFVDARICRLETGLGLALQFVDARLGADFQPRDVLADILPRRVADFLQRFMNLDRVPLDLGEQAQQGALFRRFAWSYRRGSHFISHAAV